MSGNEKLYGFFVVLWILSAFGENLDDGCGHAVLGPESGVLSSRNYPGTYPNHSWCEWRIRAPEGSSLVLALADLDVEATDCEGDFLRVVKMGYGGEHDPTGGQKYCGNLRSNPREILTASSHVTVQFQSGQHLSGRGFLLSYYTGDPKDLLTCLDKGSHFQASKYRKYCPAGCLGVAGDVSGDISQGYRHTSVLCKAALHAGVIQDEQGGWVNVETRKGLSHYPAIRANGIQSKDGSLSDVLFTFVTDDCRNGSVLRPISRTFSSRWHKEAEPGQTQDRTANESSDSSRVEAPEPSGRAGGAGALRGRSWGAGEDNNSLPWLQMDLGEKKKITGIITSGSTAGHVRSYKVLYKEKNRWKTYTQNSSSDFTVLEGNQDSVHDTRTSLHPPIVTRSLRLVPLTWHQRVAMTVELQGCTHLGVNVSSQVTLETMPTKPKPPTVGQEMTEPVPSHADLVKLVIIIVPTVLSVVLLLTGVCVCKMLQKKKTKESSYGSSDVQTGCWKQVKHPCTRHQSAEFTISYSPDQDPTHKLDLVTSTMAECQQPLMIGIGTVSRKGSTFRPMDTDVARDDGNDPATHYDYLHTSNQYALPLTNQEPEYATPIIERHTFRKDVAFLSDPYSVPGAVLPRSPSHKAVESGGPRRPGVGAPVGYQTPQVKADRGRQNSEGVYDCPKRTQGKGPSEYQRPQAKPSALESYSSPRDCVRAGLAHPGVNPLRPSPEGSSGGSDLGSTR
ncbi:discoidin, CUB and LCCL domain-containing protein 1 isoform X1 [Osmerus eperlanus]|uniref:discoidin, CUB and LCCL domain-containing protein 1 isoform X1 n=1 Tax=Osmerus eperlanus TaxID=29151 RepID=UPI002E162FD5